MRIVFNDFNLVHYFDQVFRKSKIHTSFDFGTILGFGEVKIQ